MVCLIRRPTADGSWAEVTEPERAQYFHLASPDDMSTRSNFAPDRMQVWKGLPVALGTSRRD